MRPEQMDHLVQRGMARAAEGDDEALNALVLELRPMVAEEVPRYARQFLRSAPIGEYVREGVIALYEALILWQPAREAFAECLDRRIRMRLAALFLRLRDLRREIEELPV